MRRLAISGLVAVVVLCGASLTLAAPGSTTDGNDSANLDIAAIGHDNTESSVTLMFDTHEPLNNPDLEMSTANWGLDWDRDGIVGPTDACIEAQGNGTGSGITVQLTDCFSDVFATATATKAAEGAGTRVSFTFQLAEFQSAGLPEAATEYDYFVSVDDFTDEDRAPDSGFVTHTLSGTPSTPTPTPTATPTTTPTPTPTPAGSATPTPTPGPNDTSANGTPSRSTVAPGDSVDLSATSGFKASTSLSAVMNSDPVTLASFTSTSSGGFAVTVTIPSSATTGSHNIVVSGANDNDGIHRITFPITVAAASASSTPTPTSSSGARLPTTGGEFVGILLVAGALILAGIELFRKKEQLSQQGPK